MEQTITSASVISGHFNIISPIEKIGATGQAISESNYIRVTYIQYNHYNSKNIVRKNNTLQNDLMIEI